MKNIRKKFLLIFLLLIILLSGEVLATNEYKAIEKSAEFEKWEKLSEEERKNTIQPAFTDLKISDSMKKSTYNGYIGLGDSSLERRYVSRNNIVKNQEQTGLCWAFSFTSALENTISKKYNKQSVAYSPIYIDYNVCKSFNKKIGDGANSYIAISSSVSKSGVAYEEEIPFENYYNEARNPQDSYYLSYENINLNNIESKVKIKDTVNFANIYKTYGSGNTITYRNSSQVWGAKTYTQEEVNLIRNQIKKHIKEYGAVMSSTYASYLNINSNYNSETKAFYGNNSLFQANHAITIVGWDDNYAKENFKEGRQPANNGAYIVLNSWGEEFGDAGYYYISYDDAHIEQEVVGIKDVQEYSQQEKDYNNLYEYDPLGQTLSCYFLNSTYTQYTDVGYMANVFKREDSTKNEYVSEVGIFVPITEGIEIYIDRMNGDMKDYGNAVASYTGANALEPGYHNIKLSSQVKLEGEKFAIIVKYINTGGAQYPLECNFSSSGIAEGENICSTATSKAGESYISLDGNNWNDMYGYAFPKTTTELGAFKDSNACIKAFTVLSDRETEDEPEEIAVSGVEISEKNLIINKGNTASLVATVKPENATNKNIVWSSSDENIATVTNGIVTGVAEGTTTVTVTTVDGNKTDTCTVVVTANSNPPEVIHVTDVRIDLNLAEGDALAIDKGKTYTINAIVSPSNATNKNIVWSSSNENVATVRNGVITAVSEGTAIITVTTEDKNKTDSVTVKVVSNTTKPVESVTLNKRTLKMEVGDQTNLEATINPSDASNKNVIWKSSNESVATITNTGIIKAIAEGKTTITVTTVDGNKTASCDLTVVKKTNFDDDQYKSDGEDKIKNPDNTIADKDLPNTGLKIILMVLATGVLVIGAIAFVKYKEYLDIK